MPVQTILPMELLFIYLLQGRNPILMIDPKGDDWYVNEKSGDYQWYEGSSAHKGFTHVGENKVTFNSNKNQVEVFHLQEIKPLEIISMAVETDINGKFVRYKDNRAARFAMSSAELGGSEGSTEFDALVISASMTNRLAALNSGRYSKYDIEHSGLVDEYNKPGTYTVQDLFTFSKLYSQFNNFESSFPV